MSGPAAEKQSQIITSEDKKVQILNHAAGSDQFGCYMVKGAVRNISPESDIEIELRVEYFDIEGRKIDSEVDALTIPKPGGSRGFHIVYPGQRYDDVKSYKIYPFAKKAD
jgi:hypothetical protein